MRPADGRCAKGFMNKKTLRGDARRNIITPTIRSPKDWKPEPCGLTREQVRAIIIEQIG